MALNTHTRLAPPLTFIKYDLISFEALRGAGMEVGSAPWKHAQALSKGVCVERF